MHDLNFIKKIVKGYAIFLSFLRLHQDILAGRHRHYVLGSVRSSVRSSFKAAFHYCSQLQTWSKTWS